MAAPDDFGFDPSATATTALVPTAPTLPQVAAAEHLPLDDTFQAYLVREICEDRAFAAHVIEHLKAGYFDNPIHAWAFDVMVVYRERYGVPPTWAQVIDATRRLDAAEGDNYATYLGALGGEAPLLPDVKRWISDQVLSFVRERFFVDAHHQAYLLHSEYKRPVEAQAYLIEKMAQLQNLDFRPGDRAFHFETLSERQEERLNRDYSATIITTGFPTIDKTLQGPGAKYGGMEIGRLAIWIAYAKGGKSTMLLANGIAACRAGVNVLHFVYEGTRRETQVRYDASFGQVDSLAVNRGEIPRDVLEKMHHEYRTLHRRLVVRGFTSAEENAWNCSVQTITDELAYLKQVHNWQPQVIIVDYGDLLTGRDKFYRSTVDRQTAAFQDLKTLANRGYAVYTATQPQRPSDDADIKPHVIRSTQIADCYAKVRIADVFGSLNSTLTERDDKVARIYVEMARGSPADREFTVRADFPRMTIREEAGLLSPHEQGRGHTSTRRLGDLGATNGVGEPIPKQGRAF